MCDLIDLKSPDNNKIIRGSKLPSPLIPAPENVLVDNSPASQACVLDDVSLGSRKSVDNNPFDMVLRKTSEYVSKSEDPFEIVWEKAVTSKDNKMNDPTKNKKKKSKMLGRNKTLEDSILTLELDLNDGKNHEKLKAPSIYIEPPTPINDLSILSQSAMNDSLRVFSNDCVFSPSKNFQLPSMSSCQSPFNASILNQSTMNDSFSSCSSGSYEERKIKSLVAHRISMCIQKGTMDAEMLEFEKPHIYENLHKLRRSFSQGDHFSPTKFQSNKSLTTFGRLQQSATEDTGRNTGIIDDLMNQAFLPRARENLTSYGYSDISSISQINSTSNSGVSSFVGDTTANRAFIETSTMNAYKSKSVEPIGSNISDLVEKFNHLKMKLSSRSSCSEYLDLESEQKYIGGKKRVINISSDSVFMDNNAEKNSILSEAANLAKTFEDLAYNSSRGSDCSNNDVLPNQLPNSCNVSLELDVPTDNLIELQPSPVKSTTNQVGTQIIQKDGKNESNDQTSFEKNNTKDNMKKLETELLGADKKIEAVTLLMNLEQLVRTENNPKAIELLENLEKVLGLKCQSNTELLSLCMEDTTNLSNSIKAHGENDKDISIENVKETKVDVNTDESIDQLSCEDNLNIDEPIKNHEKSVLLEEKAQNTSQLESPHTDETEEKENYVDKKLVTDIKIALNKLLTGLSGEPEVLLKNLNKVFNLNNDNESSQEHLQYSTSPMKKITTPPRKSGVPPFRSVKSLTRQSMDSNLKKKPVERTLKRRSFAPQLNDSPKKPESKARVDSPKKQIRKRMSSDPGQTHDVSERKIPQPAVKIKSSLPFVDKAKFRKKTDDLSTKKGPLKAVIPLGNMQRRKSISKKPTPEVSLTTPSKISRRIPAALKITTSTPDLNLPISINCPKKSPKTKPVASSTPDVGKKTWQTKIQVPQSPKHNMSWNISPVTPTAPGSYIGESMNRKSKLTPASPRSQVGTPRKLERSGTFNRSPRSTNTSIKKQVQSLYSRHSDIVQVSSQADTQIKNPKNTQSSPLKDKNGSKTKVKMNLFSKLRRHSDSHGSQKENKINY